MDPYKSQDEIFRLKYLKKAPGDASTKAYLASKYLDIGQDDSASDKKKKKRKTLKKIKKGNIGIVDEDNLGWQTLDEAERAKILRSEENERLEAEAAANGTGVFRGRSDGWQTVQEANIDQDGEFKEPVGFQKEEQDEEEDEEDRPMVVEDAESGAIMSSGQKAGLLTKSEIRKETARAREAERLRLEQLKDEESGQGTETVYRDETGRKVDPKIKRAEEARAEQEAIDREKRRMEWGKGLVQRNEASAQKKQLEEEKAKPLARYADDAEYNQEQKGKERWNDPAAGFLTKKTTLSKGKRGPTKPTYNGSWLPNRFQIPPGYRWDGVDRSTGYEQTFFLKLNQAKSRKAEAHMWATEDM